MPYGSLTPISITATVQSYTASAKLGLKMPFCANNNISPILDNVQVQQINQVPTTQPATGTTTSFWFAVSGTINYTPVGSNQAIQVPFRFILPSISFTGTAGQTPTVAATIGTPQLVNAIVANNCAKAVTVVVPVTFTATFPAAA